jgi:signal transduction histidine kinase
MRTGPRGRSLFWTISGLFLLAIALGTLVQILVAVAVLRPLEAREARTRAELAASGLAADIAAAPAPLTRDALHALLEKHRTVLGTGPGLVAYRDAQGHLTADPPNRGHFIERVITGVEPDRPPGDTGRSRPRVRHEVIVRHPVARGAETLGEAIALRPLWPQGPGFFEPRSALLFLPIAVIASFVVALFVVRMLVRRLRAMEPLAARVAEGDLTVRIADGGGDEIGRVAARLDWMTGRLAEARVRVEETEQQRRQLFADITHELATPLTSIRGYAETLLDPAVSVSSDERTRYLRGVLEESRRLDRLIRDLFELARLEAGASALTLEPLDWAALCRNTVARFEPRFRDAGLRLLWLESAEPAWIEADGHRMEQVLENLLANALRYVPSEGTVELALTPVPGHAGRFRLTVSDDGPGLSPDDLSHAFERFYRAAGVRVAGAARDSGGSGLGLAIVREIVERHGGTVNAEKREPHGLAIIIELPAKG